MLSISSSFLMLLFLPISKSAFICCFLFPDAYLCCFLLFHDAYLLFYLLHFHFHCLFSSIHFPFSSFFLFNIFSSIPSLFLLSPNFVLFPLYPFSSFLFYSSPFIEFYLIFSFIHSSSHVPLLTPFTPFFLFL